MKKNQIFTPGPRWCDISASLLPFENSGAIWDESSPVGPRVSSFHDDLNACFWREMRASMSLILLPDEPAAL